MELILSVIHHRQNSLESTFHCGLRSLNLNRLTATNHLGCDSVTLSYWYEHFGGNCCLHLKGEIISQERNKLEACNKLCLFMLDSFLAYSTNLMMVATCSSETSVDFQRTTRRYSPEDRILHNHRCDSLKFCNF
jgi:hypothetical protein